MKQIIMRLSIMMLGVSSLFFFGDVFADATVTLGSIQTNIGTSIVSIAKILEDVSLIAGIGFIMASFFKFHQHKLNPTQVPISQGITLLLIGAGLTVFPHLLPTATHAVFGTAAISTKSGGAIVSMLGGGT